MKRLDQNKELLAEAATLIRQHGNIGVAYRTAPKDRPDLRACLEFLARTARMPLPAEARRTHTVNLRNAERRRQERQARDEWINS